MKVVLRIEHLFFELELDQATAIAPTLSEALQLSTNYDGTFKESPEHAKIAIEFPLEIIHND